MEKEIIVAIISASGVVLAALIAGVFSLVKRSKENENTNINIKQKVPNGKFGAFLLSQL